MPEVSVEYEVLLGVKVDTDTGDVKRVVVHTGEFNGVVPLQVFGDVDYLDMESDIAKQAIEIANTVNVDEETNLLFTYINVRRL